MWTFLGAMITTLGVIATTIIQTHTANKNNKIESILNDIKVDIKNEKMARCKVDLINVMSRIKNGYEPTDEERRILIEEKEEYNHLGGDSYVDDMYEKLQREGKL